MSRLSEIVVSAILDAKRPSKEEIRQFVLRSLDRWKNKLEVGESVIRGTTVVSDLADAYLYRLNQLDPAKYNEVVSEYSDCIEAAKRVGEGSNSQEDYDLAHVLVLDVLDRLFQKYCPPATYFGSHPGDGTDIGCWPDYERLDDAEKYQDEDTLIVLEKDGPEAQEVREGRSRLSHDVAAWRDGDAWEVWDIPRAKLIWRY